MGRNFPMLQIVPLLITFLLTFCNSSVASKYDLKSVNVAVDYGGKKPPPQNEDWEYLTYRKDSWIFLSINDNTWDAQNHKCVKLQETLHNGKVEDYQKCVTTPGIEFYEDADKNAVLDLLAKLKVKSLWDGMVSDAGVKQGTDDMVCYFHKLNQQGDQYELDDGSCNEMRTAVCSCDKPADLMPWKK